MSPVFRHGRLRLYLLKLLDEAPKHGYEVIRLLQDRFMGVYAPSPGTIYPRLARLEEEGLVTHDEIDGRKVYKITEKGRAEIRDDGCRPSALTVSSQRCAFPHSPLHQRCSALLPAGVNRLAPLNRGDIRAACTIGRDGRGRAG